MRGCGQSHGIPVRPESAVRAQSAMEYLMTYGWAILVIAVVLVALYSLGVFNGYAFAPKVPPGSCYIYRNQVTGVQLVGECSRLPMYTAQFDGKDSSSNISFAQIPQSFTISVWANTYAPAPGGFYPAIFQIHGNHLMLYENAGSTMIEYIFNTTTGPVWCEVSSGVTTGIWYNYIVSYNGSYMTAYLDGKLVDRCPESGPPIQSPFKRLTVGQNYGGVWDGLIANLQFYNVSLNASAVQALYVGGIGAAPVEPQYIIGYWPLNGNSKDYSGFGNDGESFNVSYTGAWYNGYTFT